MPEDSCDLWSGTCSQGLSSRAHSGEASMAGCHKLAKTQLYMGPPEPQAFDPSSNPYADIIASSLPHTFLADCLAPTGPEGLAWELAVFLALRQTISPFWPAQHSGHLPRHHGHSSHSLCPQKHVGRGRAQTCEGGDVGSTLRANFLLEESPSLATSASACQSC